MPTVSQSVEHTSHRIRRSTIPVRQTADRDTTQVSRQRRVSFHDQPRNCPNLKAPTHLETLKSGDLNSNPVDSFSSFTSSKDRRKLSAEHSPPIFNSHSLLHAIKSVNCGVADTRLVINGLEGLLAQSKSVKLNIRHLVEGYLAVIHERETKGKEIIRANEAVFGVPLHELSKHAFMTALFNGHDLRLPNVIFNCVEELYRTGIYQSDLFRTLPNRRRLSELVRIFNSPDPHPNYEAGNRNRRSKVAEYNATLLYLESTQDICALLTDYLSSLPEPIVPPYLLDAIWEAGGLNKEADESQSGLLSIEETKRRQNAPSLVRTYTDEREATRIKVVQYLLCLLPLPNFSMIVYLLAFFSHVAMMRDVNGASTQELGRLFGTCMFGSGERNGACNTKDGRLLMSWFLRRWGALLNSLFDVLETCSTKHSPTAEGNLTLPVYTDTTSSDSLYKGYDRPSLHHTQLPSHDAPSSRNINCAKNHQSGTAESRDYVLTGQCLPRKNSTITGPCDKDVREPVEEQKELSLPTTSVSMSRATSIYSAPSIDERLLDVAFPALFDNFPLLDNASSEALVAVPSTGANQLPVVHERQQEHPPVESDNKELLQAQEKIRKLEVLLVKSDAMVGQTMEVIFRAKRRIDEIDDRLEKLAIVLRCRRNSSAEFPPNEFGSGGDGRIVWKERYEMVLMERMQAYEEVMALRELMSEEL